MSLQLKKWMNMHLSLKVRDLNDWCKESIWITKMELCVWQDVLRDWALMMHCVKREQSMVMMLQSANLSLNSCNKGRDEYEKKSVYYRIFWI